MKILTDLIFFLNSLPLAIVLAFLAFLVSVVSAYNSSRAIRLSQRAEKRLVEVEANAKQLRIIEKQNEITKCLNDALIDLSHANTLLKLCRLSLPIALR